MAKSQITFSKQEREKKKLQKKKEKLAKREERKENTKDGSLYNMMAYVDEYGNITDTPPDPNAKTKKVNASDIEIGVSKKEELPGGERRGRVVFFNESKGYGFIDQEDTRDRFFVHANNTMESIKDNDRVSFEAEEGPKGLIAVKVKVLR